MTISPIESGERCMQRVTNCILINNGSILLLKKPRRGWYAIPGGKMEQGELVKEAVLREYSEETGLRLVEPQLCGIFTFSIYEADKLIREWMMFTFRATSYEGELIHACPEGDLEWVPIYSIPSLPMAEGDRSIFEHVLQSEQILYGNFSYTTDDKLLASKLDPAGN